MNRLISSAILLMLATPSMAGDTSAETIGHCAAGETSIFHCEVAKSKHLSLCRIDNGMQYRYGPIGKPELVFPEDPKTALKVFSYGERNLARASERSVQFTNKGVVYDIFEVTGGSDDSGAGVNITENDKLLATVSCLNQTWTEDFDTLQKVLPAQE